MEERISGGLIGLAVCDALGMPNEVIRHPRQPKRLTSMEGGGELGLPPGAYTDDAQFALALSESMVESNGFDPQDQMDKYKLVVDNNYMGSTDKNIGTGRTIRKAVETYKRTGLPYMTITNDPDNAGNGSIMRLFPVPAFYAYNHPVHAIRFSGDSARVTHSADASVDAARYLGYLIHSALNGASKDYLLSDFTEKSEVREYWKAFPLHEPIRSIARGSFKSCNPKLSGGAADTLESALSVFADTDSFKDGAVEAVSLGGDSDTRGAVFGQLAGAHYGVESIPRDWRHSLLRKELVESTAHRLYASAKANAPALAPVRSF
jgi:ADP-ribosylglycohydrolase